MRLEKSAVESVTVVRSPEQVALEMPVAGPTSRMFAYAVDYVTMVLLAVLVIVGFAIAAPTVLRGIINTFGGRVAEQFTRRFEDTTVLLVIIGAVLALYVIEVVYFVFWEAVSGGRSPGKWLAGLRVIRDTGLPITLRASLIRNLLRVVDSLPVYYVIGLVSMVGSAHGQRLGDLAAGTLVVRLDRPPPVPELGPVSPDAFAFRFDRVQAGRIGPEEAALARETLRRLDQLPEEKRARLLAVASGALVARLEYEAVPAAQQRAFLEAILEAARLR